MHVIVVKLVVNFFFLYREINKRLYSWLFNCSLLPLRVSNAKLKQTKVHIMRFVENVQVQDSYNVLLIYSDAHEKKKKIVYKSFFLFWLQFISHYMAEKVDDAVHRSVPRVSCCSPCTHTLFHLALYANSRCSYIWVCTTGARG